jgi:hypothetical protein
MTGRVWQRRTVHNTKEDRKQRERMVALAGFLFFSLLFYQHLQPTAWYCKKKKERVKSCHLQQHG